MGTMAAGPEQRLSPEERANLTAYLDGELTENESSVIAAKLAVSGTARKEAESLKRTWEMLESLPLPKASVDLPDRTFTSLRSLQSKGSYWEEWFQKLFALGMRGALLLIISLASLGLGFWAIRAVWPDPTARLARDLSLAEHLKEYQEAGSFEFLEALAKSNKFGRPSR
jgi:hypothetical protein